MEKRCFNQYDLFKPHQVRRFLSDPGRSIITDIILLDNTPIGWAAYFTRKNSRLIRMYSICVHPDHSGKGYPREYLNKRLLLFEKKYSAMILEVRASNGRAIRLYEGLGFKVKKKLPGYYPDDEDGLKMIKYFKEKYR